MPTARASDLYRPHAEAPARVARRPIQGEEPGLASEAFELVSRGDFVNGRLDRPAGGDVRGLVIVLHDAGREASDPALDDVIDWVRSGWAVARIDLPLHGHRASPKLSARLVDGIGALAASATLDADTRALVEEWARQAVSDVLRSTEALVAESDLAAGPVVFVGLGLGAWIAAWAAPHADDLAACALAGGIGRLADPAFDPGPTLSVSRARGTRFLFEACAESGRSLPADQEALFGDLPEPRTRIDAHAGTATGLGKAMREAIGALLTQTLDD